MSQFWNRRLLMQAFDDSRTGVSDEELCIALRAKLNVDASKALSNSCSNGSAVAKRAELPQKGALQQGCKVLTVEDFVSRTLPLLELERDAEFAQVGSIHQISPSTCHQALLSSVSHVKELQVPDT